ncbi:MAG: intermembrane transport protein PqiB [Pseudomonadota bacterium]
MNQAEVNEAEVRPARRWSPVWIVPLVALAIGTWTLVRAYLDQGPEIEVRFSTAEGLVAGETKVKTLEVEVGVVEQVRLADDFGSVTALIKLDRKAAPLLTEDAQLWVVRPQIGAQGISGLSTILSGAYIQLTPGSGSPGAREFRGLDQAPVTPPSTPGLQVRLLADNAGSMSVGSPVLYRGYRVGRVESVALDTDSGQTRYTAFIDAPYDELVRSTTRFWNASGISLSASVDGFDVRTESLESLLTGGVTFSIPDGLGRGQPVSSGANFYFYDNIGALTENPHVHATPYQLEFETSVRGLEVGAPVDYLGMRVGTVMSVGIDDFHELWRGGDAGGRMPVEIHLEPGWLGEDSGRAADEFADSLTSAVRDGLRASLAIGNLLTGSLYVSLDFHPEAAPAEIVTIGGERHLPTVASGLEEIEGKVAAFLSKLQELPIEATLDSASTALAGIGGAAEEARATIDSLTTLLGSPGVSALPQEVVGTLTDARDALRGLGPDAPLQREAIGVIRELKEVLADADAVIQTYERQPNAFVFPARQPIDPQPRGANSP